MVIFLGACSGVVRGKVTVRIPSLIDALISSGCRRKRQEEVECGEETETHLDALGKWDRTREPAKPALPDRVALLVALAGDGGLARDAKDAVLDVDLDVLLRQPWQLKRRRHEVFVLVLVQVHPEGSSQHRPTRDV